MEQDQPVHRVGRCPPHRAGEVRSRPRRLAARRIRDAPRRAAHVAAEPRHPDRRHRPRRRRPALDPGQAHVAPQREALRRAAGQGQGADPRGVRRGAVHALASVLRRSAAAASGRRRVQPGGRPALRRHRRRRARDRVAQARHRSHAAVLAQRHRARPPGGQDRAGDRPRQLPARPRQAPRGHQRRRHRRAEHPDRNPARLPSRRVPDPAGPRRVPRSGGRRRRRRRGRLAGQGLRSCVSGQSDATIVVSISWSWLAQSPVAR